MASCALLLQDNDPAYPGRSVCVPSKFGSAFIGSLGLIVTNPCRGRTESILDARGRVQWLQTDWSKVNSALLNLPVAGKQVPALDGVRGWAILPVMLYHFTINFKQVPLANSLDRVILAICGAGWIGVDLFFVLSGFLITGILYDTREQPCYFSAFYARRALRIFPLYYAVLALVFCLLPVMSEAIGGRMLVLKANQAWFWTYLINWRIAAVGHFNAIPGGYFWSLAVEEQFYLVWPALVLLCGRSIFQLSAFLFALAIVLRPFLYALGVTTTALYVMTITHLDGLVVGAMLAVYLRTRTLTDSTLHWFKISAGAALAGVALVFFLERSCYFYTPGAATIVYPLLAVFFGWILTSALRTDHAPFVRCLVEGSVIRSFGKYSYALYLIHHPIGTLVERHIFNPVSHTIAGSVLPAMFLYALLCTILCWLAAITSWNLYERHFLRLKHYFPYRRATSPAILPS